MTIGRERVVGEFDLSLVQDGAAFVLPVAIVVEPGPADRSVWIRTYHSQWPLLGHHVVRPPLLARDPDAHESDVVGRYQAALAVGDADAITATFEPDGCFREPAGPQFRRCGTDVLLPFFSLFFSAGGGIVLEHCSVTEDGVRTALEFNAVKWGGVRPAPAGRGRRLRARPERPAPRGPASTTTSRARSSEPPNDPSNDPDRDPSGVRAARRARP